MNRAESGKVIKWMVLVLKNEVLAKEKQTTKRVRLSPYKRRNYGL
jgi:hypothetical protein